MASVVVEKEDAVWQHGRRDGYARCKRCRKWESFVQAGSGQEIRSGESGGRGLERAHGEIHVTPANADLSPLGRQQHASCFTPHFLAGL